MMTTSTGPAEAVTVNVEALWILQAMLDISTLPTELRTLPYGAAQSKEWLATSPEVTTLAQMGVVGPNREVLESVAQRLRVLAAPDIEVVIVISHGEIKWDGPIDVDDPETWKRTVPDDQLRVVLARRDGRWVSAVRGGADITIDDVEGAEGFSWISDVLTGMFDSFAPGEPSRITAMNLPADDWMAAAKDRAGALRDGNPAAGDIPLRALGVPPHAVAELAELMEAPLAEAVVYARAYTDARVSTSEASLDVRATSAGRVATYRMPSRPGVTQDFLTVVPATTTQLAQGLQAVLGTLNVGDWAHHRRMG